MALKHGVSDNSAGPRTCSWAGAQIFRLCGRKKNSTSVLASFSQKTMRCPTAPAILAPATPRPLTPRPQLHPRPRP
eukprot:CAMPEP_0203864894 /NCGR_PEP_ID=MMETSP0359-20131031/15036_1 /ASSEMBLY_ACC=CAM_ASM_000338 /TAXON_ID=268821 /ORGANISM="Scrippsiella Hangoei, Strain SHTV-5" /LENGTH=75 /DNA_ID=CAMNT_0050782715 /DNA_START=184 /DNA_END=407 /DNA_ORIENTATION=+